MKTTSPAHSSSANKLCNWQFITRFWQVNDHISIAFYIGLRTCIHHLHSYQLQLMSSLCHKTQKSYNNYDHFGATEGAVVSDRDYCIQTYQHISWLVTEGAVVSDGDYCTYQHISWLVTEGAVVSDGDYCTYQHISWLVTEGAVVSDRDYCTYQHISWLVTEGAVVSDRDYCIQTYQHISWHGRLELGAELFQDVFIVSANLRLFFCCQIFYIRGIVLQTIYYIYMLICQVFIYMT